MNNTIIFCLVGESGSGKSSVVNVIGGEDNDYKVINSFTTREARYKDEGGHIFVKEELYWLDKESGNIAAETYFDKNYYWTTKDQLTGTCLYIIDTKGIEYLKQNCPEKKLVVIYLKCDKENRLMRMLDRDTSYIRVHQRLKHDEIAFSVIKTDYTVDSNRPLEEVVEDVKSIISLEIAVNEA